MKESNSPHLLVFRLSALGDVAMAVHVLLALRRSYPGISLTFITKPHYTPVPQRIPGLKTHPAHTESRHRGLPGLWRLRTELRRLRPDGIADLHFVLRSRILGFFMKGSGIPVAQLDKGRAEKKRLTAAEHKTWAPLKSTHERYAKVFESLGYPVELTGADVLKAEAWPELTGLPRPDARTIAIGIAPFAAHEGKCYPPELMKKVLRQLGEHPDIRIYLFGGGSRETALLLEWEREFENCNCVAGKGTLSEELALISNLRLMLSMDSGNGHLAAMYGLPVVTLWGVTHPFAGFAPFGQPEANQLTSDRERFPQIPTSVYGNRVPEGYEKAMESISPARVVGRILEILKETP